MNRINKALVLGLYVVLILIFLFLLNIKFICPFKYLFNIPCMFCGMTRAFRCIIHFNIIESFSYNILALPLFLVLIFIFVICLYDLIFDKNILKKVFDIIIKYYYVIIVLFLISWIINIIRGV